MYVTGSDPPGKTNFLFHTYNLSYSFNKETWLMFVPCDLPYIKLQIPALDSYSYVLFNDKTF